MPGELAECVERANLDPEVHVARVDRQRHRVLWRLRPGRERRGDAGGLWRAGEPRGLAAGPSASRPAITILSGTWDPVTDFHDVATLRRVHEPLPLREAGPVQGPRLLRSGLDLLLWTCWWSRKARRSGPIRPPACGAYRPPRCGRRESVLRERSACSSPETPLVGNRGGGVGAGRRGSARGRTRRPLRVTRRTGCPAAHQPARHAQAAGQSGPLCPGPAGALQVLGTFLRRHRAAHAGGLRLLSSASLPRRAPFARRCASAMSPSATTDCPRSRADERAPRQHRVHRGEPGAPGSRRSTGERFRRTSASSRLRSPTSAPWAAS